jgi:urea-proton symporter
MIYMTQTVGYMFLAIFGLVMLLITKKKKQTKEGFLLANRKVGWHLGGFSIAASWLWAPALFISVQIAYQKGLAGIFWFTAPNILALAIFAILAPKIRKKFPEGYTLPQYIKHKLGRKAHKIYLVPYFFYQVMAITVQLFAGGSLVSLLTGIPLLIVMPILATIALAYTLISGLEASVKTDFMQMSLIFLIGLIIIPMSLSISKITVVAGNTFGNIFDPGVAFSFGIVTAIGLIAGAISDQQYWQRAFAIKKKHLGKAFLFGAVLFGIVPIALSTLGFIARAMNITVPAGVDVSMIGVQTVATLLPSWAVLLFVIMLLAGLSSTLDSGLSAASSLWVIDVAKKKTVKTARKAMIGITVVGLLIAIGVIYIPGFGLQHLWWVFNTIAACVMVPTVLSLYWDRLSEKGVVYGVSTAFIVGIPLFIYGNIIGSAAMIVSASLFIVAISTGFCLALPKKNI